MKTELKIAAEAVGAFVVCGSEEVFLGANHTKAKELSEKLPSQISYFTETKRQGESDQEALIRLLTKEEVLIEGVSDRPLFYTKLSDALLATKIGNATLTTYMFQAGESPLVRIIKREVSEVGQIPFDTVLSAPAGSWWIRWGVNEAIQDAQRLMANPSNYSPSIHLQFRDRVPAAIFELIRKGISEAEALSRLGLHAPDQPLPYSFAHLQSKPLHL